MLSEPILTEIIARLGMAAPVHFDEVTGSTNATAARLAREGAPEWTLVAAGHQTEGRGRQNRPWVDRPGGALLVSIVLRPELEPDRAGLLSLLCGVALAQAARRLAADPVACKWPNDLVSEQQGERRKVGGILAEASVDGDRIEHVVLGIGVNLGRPPAGVEGAGSLVGVGQAGLLEAFLKRFRDRYDPAAPSFGRDVVAVARTVSSTLGQRVRATTVRGDPVVGEAVDLDESGGLVVETESGPRTVAFGDVELLRPAG